MKKTYKVLFGLLFIVSCSISSFAQENEENEGELPEFLEMRKPNFFKAQRRAERYFKKKNIQARMEETELDSFALENRMGGREEDNEYHRFKRWEWFWRDKIEPDGSFPDPLKSFAVYKELQATSANLRTEEVNPTWTSIGMNKNSGGYWGLGQARSVAVFPGNPQIYYVTTVGGGVWKTTNGGSTYTPIGDGLPQLFCGNILVDRQDANIVYVGLGGTGEWWLAGLGVYKSIDGGATWNSTGLTGTRANGLNIKKMAMSPTDSKVILAATDKGLYRTVNAGANWTIVRTGDHNDVVFRPRDGSTVYAGNTELYTSVDGGANWTKKTSLGKNSAMWIGVSESDQEFVSVLFRNSKELYVSTDRGNSYSIRSNSLTTSADIFYVSQTNKNFMYSGAVNLSQSTDGGTTWKEITNWCCGTAALPEIHADFHGVTHNPTNMSELYFCNDGGTYKYNESTKVWTNLCNGLVITMYYYISSAQTNNNIVLGATQDNGGNMRKTDGTWRNTVGGDATLALHKWRRNSSYQQYLD
jgi:photosystem II stability/assembly factor-like uncharacterized protein